MFYFWAVSLAAGSSAAVGVATPPRSARNFINIRGKKVFPEIAHYFLKKKPFEVSSGVTRVTP